MRGFAAACGRWVDSFLASFNRYLASRAGFVHATVLSFFWVGGAYALVFIHLTHLEASLIFAYLAFATAFSFITQFNVTNVAERAAQTAELARERADAADQSTIEMLSRMTAADDADREVLAALERSLLNQAHMLDALVSLAERDATLGEEIEAAIQKLVDVASTAQTMHLANAELFSDAHSLHTRNGQMIERLLVQSARIANVAIARGAKIRRLERERDEPADGDAKT